MGMCYWEEAWLGLEIVDLYQCLDNKLYELWQGEIRQRQSRLTVVQTLPSFIELWRWISLVTGLFIAEPTMKLLDLILDSILSGC